MMLHHISIGVADIQKSMRFYDAVLGALGYVQVWQDICEGDDDQAVGYGIAGGGDLFCLKQQKTTELAPGPGFHIAFTAPDKGAVTAFYQAALLHGASCNGEPGPRPDYGDFYYAAFVVDPDGYRLEAVINKSTDEGRCCTANK